MGCRRKNTLCLSLDFGANDGTLLPRLTRLETSPSPPKRLVLKFPINERSLKASQDLPAFNYGRGQAQPPHVSACPQGIGRWY